VCLVSCVLYLLPLLLFLLLSGEAELRSSDKTDRCDIDRGDVEGRRGEERRARGEETEETRGKDVLGAPTEGHSAHCLGTSSAVSIVL